jgi:hypothetical protein
MIAIDLEEPATQAQLVRLDLEVCEWWAHERKRIWQSCSGPTCEVCGLLKRERQQPPPWP